MFGYKADLTALLFKTYICNYIRHLIIQCLYSLHRLLQVRNSSRIRNLAELKARQEEERVKRERERERERERRERQYSVHLAPPAVQQRSRRRLARPVL